MTDWKPTSLNLSVRFKLTEKGEEYWTSHYSGPPNHRRPINLPEKEGEFYVTQLWFFIQILGPIMDLKAHHYVLAEPMQIEVFDK